ncbi:MAG: hypothetical protein BJ554DRAFT_5117, partial [Olpidium bornovanus]
TTPTITKVRCRSVLCARGARRPRSAAPFRYFSDRHSSPSLRPEGPPQRHQEAEDTPLPLAERRRPEVPPEPAVRQEGNAGRAQGGKGGEIDSL